MENHALPDRRSGNAPVGAVQPSIAMAAVGQASRAFRMGSMKRSGWATSKSALRNSPHIRKTSGQMFTQVSHPMQSFLLILILMDFAFRSGQAPRRQKISLTSTCSRTSFSRSSTLARSFLVSSGSMASICLAIRNVSPGTSRSGILRSFAVEMIFAEG
jgi:hypothetical protein